MVRGRLFFLFSPIFLTFFFYKYILSFIPERKELISIPSFQE